jgi:hypothetical protein
VGKDIRDVTGSLWNRSDKQTYYLGGESILKRVGKKRKVVDEAYFLTPKTLFFSSGYLRKRDDLSV